MRYFLLALTVMLSCSPAMAAKVSCLNSFNNEGSFEIEDAKEVPNLFDTLDPTRDVDPNSVLNIAMIVVSTVGIENFIGLYETEATATACAARDYSGKRAIWVNPKWFADYAGNDFWVRFGIIAHEVGHHLNDHTADGSNDRWQREFQADKFVGRAVRIVGGTLEQALSTVEHTAPIGSHSHPNRSVRLAAIEEGFNMTFQIPKSVEVLTDVNAIDQSNAQPDRVSIVGSLGWTFVGSYDSKNSIWLERVYDQLDGTPNDLPASGTILKARTDVNVRSDVPFKEGNSYRFPEIVGLVGENNAVRVLSTKIVAEDNVWAQIERVDGGTP